MTKVRSAIVVGGRVSDGPAMSGLAGEDETLSPFGRAAGADALGNQADCETPIDGPEARECSSNEECVDTEYPLAVSSESDCYCPLCPGDYGRAEPLNMWKHACFLEQWLTHCSDWTKENPCLPQPCSLPDSPICHDGVCGQGTR